MELLFFLCQPWLQIIVLPLSTMVTCKETCAVIIASKIAPKSTIHWIIKNFKMSGSIVVKKTSGRPRKSSKRQDRLLKLIQLRDRGTTSTELAQELLLEDGLVSRRAAKNPLLSRKNIMDRYSAKGTGIGLLRTGVKSFSLLIPLSECLGHPEKACPEKTR